MRVVARVVWYRFRASFRHRRGGHLTIVLLLAVLGGLALGAVAGARRTQSSYPRFLASTDPSDLNISYNGATEGYDPVLVEAVSKLPHVRHVQNIATLNVFQLDSDGAPNLEARASIAGSVDGLFLEQDRTAVTRGRLPDPSRANEALATEVGARDLGLHVGSVVHLGFYTGDQAIDPGYGTSAVPPQVAADVTIVGIGRFSDTLVQDDAERFAAGVLLSPALVDRVLGCCANGAASGVQLDHGGRDVPAFEAAFERAIPSGTSFYLRESAVASAKVERAIKPQSIALAVFGGIAGLATLLVVGQVIGRQLDLDADELAAMRALGAGPAMTMCDGLVGVLGAVVVGSALAAAVAVAVSPLAPIGPVRTVDPSRGIDADLTILGLGALVLVVGLTAIVGALAFRRAPHRRAIRGARASGRTPMLARSAAAARLPVAATAGIRLALNPGRRGHAAPVRSALLGTALAVVVVVATLTFGSSLRTLVSRPALYGWSWDYALETPAGLGEIDGAHAARLLDADPAVGDWARVRFDTLHIDGLTIPILAGNPSDDVQPPVLDGHGLAADDQIVLGPATLAQLHEHVGDRIEVRARATSAATTLRIVGTATMPAIGPAFNAHVSMGTGALVSDQLLPAAEVARPHALFIRLRRDADPVSAARSLDAIATALGSPEGPVLLLPVQRPAEIVNYRTMGSTPALLGGGLAVGAASALALTLVASVRRRRRDLAVLKTLGFTRRQLQAAVAWQSSIAVAIGTAVGVPLGVVLGRALWDLFADNINVVPAPSTPAASLVLVVVGAVVLANLVAAVPGRIAANTPTTALLQED